MDYQNRVGSKFGGGGVAGANETAVDRRERLRQLAVSFNIAILRGHISADEDGIWLLCVQLQTIDLAKVSFENGRRFFGVV